MDTIIKYCRALLLQFTDETIKMRLRLSKHISKAQWIFFLIKKEFLTQRIKIMEEISREDIKNIIPHRDPFLLIDKIIEVEPGRKIKAVKYVREQEYYFKGHFPSNPIMPGVLIVETIAQAGAVLALMMPENKGKLVLFAGIDKARFKKIVKPGDELLVEVELENLRRNIGRAKGRATVRNETACAVEIMFVLS